jgi:phage terminase large subunit
MSTINIDLLPKQSLAWKYLTDNQTNEICFGGSAGGSKSTLGSIWITYLCLQYPGIRTLVGRTVLATLKQTTLKTLLEVLGPKFYNLQSEKHYNYNAQSNVITFSNGSEIILKDLEDKPSDINKDSLGGLELSAVWVDEAVQISFETFSVLKSRIRFKLDEYNLVPKILLTSNPGQNWLFKRFYLPWEEGSLEDNKIFIPSLPYDNKYLPDSYIEMLKELPPQQRERLLMGNWRYTDDINALFDIDSISNSIYKSGPNLNDKKYITVDVARFGSDRSVIYVWVGLVVVECHIYTKIPTTQLIDEIKSLMKSHGIHPSNCIIDSDGVGGPVSDAIRSTNFVNNSSPLFNQNFTNLKSQCYVKLSELFKEGKISINLIEPQLIDDLTQELLSVKLKNLDNDKKISVISKDEIKRLLGKSNDLSDALMFRMLPELKNNQTTKKYAISYI